MLHIAVLSTLALAGEIRIELPEGPAAEAWARVGPETRPEGSESSIPASWREGRTWSLWAEMLVAESAAPAPDPGRRAVLGRIALAQERWEDAWGHLVAAGAAPARTAALLPRFLPGATSFDPLPDGAALAPSLPPRTADVPRGRVERRAMRIAGLRVGEATIAMKVSVETEGVQIDLEHLAGGPATVHVKIPEDPDFAFANEYVDWYRQEQGGIAHAVTLKPGDEAHTLYARFEPRDLAWPTALPGRLPAQLASGTLWLEIAAGDPERALVLAVAQGLQKSPLALDARVRAPGAADDGWTGVVIDLSRVEGRGRKLAWLASSVERRALAR